MAFGIKAYLKLLTTIVRLNRPIRFCHQKRKPKPVSMVTLFFFTKTSDLFCCLKKNASEKSDNDVIEEKMSCKGGAENSYFDCNKLLLVLYPGNCTYILEFELF